eukprot:jgi/Tetstr1/438811/TSEL_027320.t1
MGFTLDDLPTSHLSEATLRKLLGGVIDLNVMRNYIKAVSGAAPSPAVITVCHTSYGTLITSDGEAWVLIDSGASSHVNAHRTDYIYYMDIPAAEQFLVGGFGQPAVGIGTTMAPTLDITGRPHTIVARDCYHTPDITSSVGLTNISRLLSTHQLSKQGYSFYFSRLLNSMITPDGAVIHLQPYPGTTGIYGIKLLPIIRDPSHGSVNRQPSPRAEAPYMLVVIDDWKGPCPSVTGAQHVFGAVDSYTGVKVVITMRTKDEAVRAVHQLHAAVLGMGHTVQRIRADRSVVYTGSPFRQACADLNIAPEFTESHSHHQAGLAERSFRTIAALASAQEGPPPPQPEGTYLPRHQEGDATSLPTPHSSESAHTSSPYVDLSDYHPKLVASAIAEVVRPYPAQMAALALPAPTVRVSKAPRNYKEAISSNHPDDWKQSMDREIASITKMETFVWISIPDLRRDNPSTIIIHMAWAFAEKQDKDGNLIKRKARVVVRGDQLTAGENYDDTKTYAPVVSFIALRTTIALGVQLDWELYQFDVTCAFLNANLDEDVYVYPPGYGRKDQAWKLVKALYGLPQAPKAWFLHFSSFLRDFGFVSSECDPGVWTLLAVDKSLLAILCVYVDDIMLATSPSSDIREGFQTSLFSTFDATTDGLCTWLLGMAIDRKPGGVLHLHQEKYINDILTTFNMAACAPRRLPCTPDTDFHDPTSTPLDTKLFPYPNLVGSLIWLAVASRPDIAFVVGRPCAYMASPAERHWQIAVSVLRYLKGTPNHGLIFRKQRDNEAPDFLFFVDADWATFVPNRRSTTGYLALVHGTLVAYRAQVQKSVALSTAEAEFVALCMACKCLA